MWKPAACVTDSDTYMADVSGQDACAHSVTSQDTYKHEMPGQDAESPK